MGGVFHPMRTLLVLTIACLVGCQTPAPASTTTIRGVALAGPTCPVVTQPPDPACDDRPVAGAEIEVRNAAGESVARVTTAEDGSFSVVVSAGRYELQPQPVEGLLGTASQVEVVVLEGVDPDPVTVVYDTGIR